MRVESFLAESTGRRPDKTALISGTRRLTYRELLRASASVASGLASAGVGRGDRVVIQLENGVEAVAAIFGTLMAGGVFVMVNPTVKPEKLGFIIRDCGARAVVCDVRLLQASDEWWARLGSLPAIVYAGDGPAPRTETASVVSLARLLAAADASLDELPSPGIDLDLAALIYTSGSTGVPKGVMLTHLNIVSATQSIAGYLENREDDVILAVLPLSFDYGLYQLFIAFSVGSTIVLERGFAYPRATLELIVRERVTGFPVVPMIAALLLRHDLRDYDLTSLRYISSTGAPLPTAHIRALRTLLAQARLYSMYGLTECKRVSFLPPDEVESRPMSVGKPMENVEVFVADSDGTLAASGTGELVIRGSNVMQGYWGRPDETDSVLRPGALPGERLLFSGDTFRIDDDGYMYFVARRDDVIKSRGEKVSPREVENVLHELPGIVEAAVIGVDDPVLGQAVKAFVTIDGRAALSEADVLRHCASRLEDVMMPKYVEFVDELPRTSTGKISRRTLKDGDAVR